MDTSTIGISFRRFTTTQQAHTESGDILGRREYASEVAEFGYTG
jgi:hypothetical protein